MQLRFACALAGALAVGATGAANACQPGDARLAGHYYLNGVMEVGSELLLKKDGSFDSRSPMAPTTSTARAAG